MTTETTAADWPLTVAYDGRSYHTTRKFGRMPVSVHHRGKPAAEYRNTDGGVDRRLWLDLNGTIYPD